MSPRTIEDIERAQTENESSSQDSSTKETEARLEKSVLQKVVVSSQLVEECKMFLENFGIDTSSDSDEEIVDKVRRIKAKRQTHAQVLSRGKVLDGLNRLLEFVPKGYVGEFVRETPDDISRKKALGFTVLSSPEANLESSTGSADSKVRLGDQILMIIPEEDYVAMQLARQDIIRKRRLARDPKAQAKTADVDPLFPIVPM